MILYLKIATDIPAGTAITTRYIMDKYKVSRSKSQSAIRSLEAAGIVSAGERRNGIKIVYTVLPGASEKIAAYGEHVRMCRVLAGNTCRAVRVVKGSPYDREERDFVSAHNRLFMVLAAKRREMRQNSGVMA